MVPPSASSKRPICLPIAPAYRAALGLGGEPAKAMSLVEKAAVEARREYGDFRPGGDFEAWFFGYLAIAYRGLEGCSGGGESEEGGAGSTRRGASDAGAAGLSSVDTDHVVQALQEVPATERLATVIQAVGGYAGAQAAELLEVHPQSAGMMLRRGRRLLKESLLDRAIANRLQAGEA